MAITGKYTRGYNVTGLSFAASSDVTSPLATPWSVDLVGAKAGTLSTRTDSNTGVLTMAGGHGITTGDRLDVYWSTGSRYGMTVGSVSGNLVPIDLGGGDDLPIATTAMTAQVPTSEPVALTGSNAVAIGINFPQGGTAVFADGSNTTIAAIVRSSTNTSYVWTSSDGGTNPLAGGTVAKVFLSTGSTVASTATGVVQFS